MKTKDSVLTLRDSLRRQKSQAHDYLAQMLAFYREEKISEASLKSLKQVFPMWQDINHDMESLIKQGLVTRYDGRYRITVPYFSYSALKELQQKAHQRSVSLLQEAHQELPYLAKHPWLLVLAAQEISKTFTGTVALPKGEMSSVQGSSYRSGAYWFVECGEGLDVGLATYFTEARDTPASQAALDFMGDVDPRFFLEMSGQVLKTLTEEGRIKGLESNIFVKSLAYFDYLELQAGQAQLKRPLVQLEETELLDMLKQLLAVCARSLEKEEETGGEAEFLRYLTLIELVKSLGLQKEVIHLIYKPFV